MGDDTPRATFTYFGETFTYAKVFPRFLYAEFLEKLQEDDVSNEQATGVALRLAIACVDEADRARWRKVSRQNNAELVDWMVVYRDWTAEVTERPTGLLTDSSAGHSPTPETSVSGPDATVTTLPTAKRPARGDMGLAVSRSQLA